MAKRHTYIIEVKFVNFRDECAIGTQTSGYLMSNGRTDTFDFKRNGFTITAERSTIYVDGTILSSDRNGLYGQVLKGLLVYYVLSNDYPKVKSISIVRKRKNPYTDITYSETSSFSQPLTPALPKPLVFTNANINVLLEETEKGAAVRIAMTYWLKANNSIDPYLKFDRYWKAYDRLLLYEGNTTTQRTAIPIIKATITANENVFVLSKALTNTYSDAYIRSFSWNHLLSSKSMSYTKLGEISRRVLEYTDARVIRLYQNLLSGSKIQTALTNAGLMATINTHFANNATTNQDIDIVLLMSLSYTYYIRCKLFHGEVPDSTFKLQKTNEDREIDELNKLLELVVFELLEHNNILR